MSMQTPQPPKKQNPAANLEIGRLLLKKTRSEQEEEILKQLIARLAEENPRALAEIIQRWLSESS